MGSLVIDMTPELEERLRVEAAARGLEATEYARVLLAEQLREPGEKASLTTRPETSSERAAFLKELQGKLAYVQTSSQQFDRQKQEEIEIEEQSRKGER